MVFYVNFAVLKNIFTHKLLKSSRGLSIYFHLIMWTQVNQFFLFLYTLFPAIFFVFFHSLWHSHGFTLWFSWIFLFLYFYHHDLENPFCSCSFNPPKISEYSMLSHFYKCSYIIIYFLFALSSPLTWWVLKIFPFLYVPLLTYNTFSMSLRF